MLQLKSSVKEQPKNKNNLVFDGKEYKTIPNETKVPWKILDKLHPDEIVNLETETKISLVLHTITHISPDFRFFLIDPTRQFIMICDCISLSPSFIHTYKE